MTFCKKSHNAQFFSDVNAISNRIWEELNCTNNIYLSIGYLNALAKHHKNILFYYVVLFDKQQKAIAFSTIQIVSFNTTKAQNNALFSSEKLKCLAEQLHIIPKKKPIKILTSGNTFVSGEHGIFIKNNQNKQQVIKQLAQSVVYFVKNTPKLQEDIKAYMLKDFVKESLPITDKLHEADYYSFKVEPNMIMAIDKEWLSFTDYLASMKTKFRVKAKKAIQLSTVLNCEEITSNNLEMYLPKMTQLYNAVADKAGFNLGKFNLNAFIDLKGNLGNNYIIKAYFLNNQLVGFLSAIINQNQLDAHFVGIDYTRNKDYAIYQRMLYDYIAIAIEKKATLINFGRTASEIKSSVGAIPQDLTIYLRHKKNIPNKLLSLFLSKIKPTPFKQKKPFKAKTI